MGMMDNMMHPTSLFSGTKCPSLWANGPDVQGFHNFPNKPAFNGPRTVTQSPVTTGSSVLAMKYEGGVLMAADTLGSYGSMARFPDLNRIMKQRSRVRRQPSLRVIRPQSAAEGEVEKDLKQLSSSMGCLRAEQREEPTRV